MKRITGPKFVFLFLVLCAAVAGVFLYAMRDAYNSRPQLAIPDLSNKRYNPKIYDVRVKLAEAQPSKIDLSRAGNSDIEEKCRGSFADLLKADLGSENKELVQALETDVCFQANVFTNSGNLNKANVLKQCAADVTTPTCQQAAIFFKVGLLDYVTKTTELNELTEQQLVAKFLAQFDPFYMNGKQQTHFVIMKKIANEMLKRNPADPQYQDAFLQSEMIPNMQSEAAPEYSADFDSLLKEKLKERPYDEKLQEYFFVRNQQKSLDEQLAEAEAIFAQNPDSSIAAYQLSALYLKKGDLLSTKKYLDRAIVLNPDSARYKETLRRFNAGEHVGIHTLTLNWGLQS